MARYALQSNPNTVMSRFQFKFLFQNVTYALLVHSSPAISMRTKKKGRRGWQFFGLAMTSRDKFTAICRLVDVRRAGGVTLISFFLSLINSVLRRSSYFTRFRCLGCFPPSSALIFHQEQSFRLDERRATSTTAVM